MRLAEGREVEVSIFGQSGPFSTVDIKADMLFWEEKQPRLLMLQFAYNTTEIIVGTTLSYRTQFRKEGDAADEDFPRALFEKVVETVGSFYDTEDCSPYSSAVNGIWKKLKESSSGQITFHPNALAKAASNATENTKNATKQMGAFQKRLRDDNRVFLQNSNVDVKITLSSKNESIDFDSVVDCISNRLQEKYPNYSFANHNNSYEDRGVHNLWVKATPLDRIHQPLDEKDYEAACRSTGLTASGMRSIQDLLVMESTHYNKERWGLLSFSPGTSPESANGDIELRYTTQDGSGTGIDALDKASALLPLALEALTMEAPDISVKATNQNELSARTAALQHIHEDVKQALAAISQTREKIVNELGNAVDKTNERVNAEAEKLGILSFIKRGKLLQANAIRSEQYNKLRSEQHDMNVGPSAWELTINAIEEVEGVDKGENEQASIAYKRTFDLQKEYTELEAGCEQRVRAGEGGITYLQKLIAS